MEKALIDAQQAVVTDCQSAIVTEPGIGPFDFPAPFVAAQLASVRKRLFAFVNTVRNNQLNTPSFQPSPQRVAVVPHIGDNPHRLTPRATAPARHFYLRQGRFRQSAFVGRGRRQECSQRNTLAIDQYHPARALAAPAVADGRAPFFAGAKLPSINVSCQFSRCRWSNRESNWRQAASRAPLSSHRRSRRQQVTPLGYWGGKSRQRAPERKTQRIPSKQDRSLAGGRPVLLRLGRPLRNSGSIFFHWPSVTMTSTEQLFSAT